MEPVAVPREQFFAAVERGDARTIAAFFAQPVSAFGVDNGAFGADALEHRAGHEWLRPFDPNTRYAEPSTMIATAIDCDYADVLAWLFAADAIDAVGLEPLALAIQAACHLAMSANALGLVELLLTSPVFAQRLAVEQQQVLLDDLLRSIASYHAPDAVRLLTSHGAIVTTQRNDSRESIVLRQAARRDNLALVDAVVRDGAWTAGVALLDEAFALPFGTIQPLLVYGARPTHAAKVLHRIVSRGAIGNATLWLAYGFLDVDARDAHGQTALMHVHKLSRGIGTRPGRASATDMAKVLLEFGASVDAEDYQSKTPLLHSLGSHSSELVRLLLEHGADPNQPTCGDLVAFDVLDMTRLNDHPEIAEQLELLLQYGANPYLPGEEGLSAVDRLEQSELGRAFMTSHPQWFAGKQLKVGQVE